MLKNKKIAVVFTASILGGHELMAIAHLRKFKQRGFSIVCFLPENNEKLIRKLSMESITYTLHSVYHRRMEIVHSFINIKYIISAISLLKNIDKKFDHIIIVQGDIELGAGFINGGRLLGISKIVSYIPYTHSFKTMESKGSVIKDFLSKFVYKNCNNYITICNDFVDDLKRKNKKAQVKLLKNSIDLPDKKYVRNIGYSFINNVKKLKILIAGRVYFRQKGQDILIESLKQYNFNIDIELVIIGDGPDLESLRHMITSLPGNITVSLLGWQENVWEFSRDIDVIVIPSNYEGVPLIMLEALKFGVPIIAPARDGMRDYLGVESLYSGEEGQADSYVLAVKLKEFIKKNKSIIYTQ